MFRMCLGEDAEHLSAAEQVAIERLIATRWRLLMDGDRVNTKSEDGSNACAAYLEAVDVAAATLRLDKAPRTYRENFTINYRALFPDQARNYRVDVLEAGFEQYATIWVNGDKFEFSAEAMRRAEALQRAWWDLGSVLERWSQASRQPQWTQRPSRSELRTSLVALDFAWASFEHKYIAELIEIEEKARRLIVRAIEHERTVTSFEEQYPESTWQNVPGYVEAQKSLVGSIGHLNSVANVRRKGRDDLVVNVLFDAMNTLRRCDRAEQGGEVSERLIAARILANDVVESYQAMRQYLREVAHCLERVDPHLCNNTGLVARLADWEEGWELGTRYMQHEKLLNALCDLVAEIRRAQRIAPALTGMCEDVDVELFMVLPRMIWLRFLAEPKQHAELLRSLLPHRFAKSADVKGDRAFQEEGVAEQPTWDDGLEAFLVKYRGVWAMLEKRGGGGSAGGNSDQAPWEILVKRVVGGSGSGIEGCHMDKEAEAAVEDLMRALEPWSIELQRNAPEDWNQCSAILVQCLTRPSEKTKPGPFRV
mmetsp:Transcript_44794/g.130456  ORF Transcript_44794/g.130456 Transcript_44794/m.130456 type:complete len:537 (-) Transcript_44794:208-1818(-)